MNPKIIDRLALLWHNFLSIVLTGLFLFSILAAFAAGSGEGLPGNPVQPGMETKGFFIFLAFGAVCFVAMLHQKHVAKKIKEEIKFSKVIEQQKKRLIEEFDMN